MRIEYKKYNITNKKNINIKIAHISDIHFAHNYKIKRLEKIKNKLKEIKPHYICITGDLIDIYDVTNDSNFIELKNWLKEISKISKLIISIGNHEYIKMTQNGSTQTEDIETNNDKMMILSYINSKIDLCDYYISILSDPKQAKKYKIPYTVQALENIKKELYAAKTKVYNKKIIENKEAVLVYYPPGYEG